MKKILFAVLLLSLVACKKPVEETEPAGLSYDVPTTYNFSNVDYSGQTYRLSMLKELSDTMKKGNTQGVAVSATQLKNMYSNTNSPFASADLNTSGKQLQNKTYAADVQMFLDFIDSLASNSTSTVSGGPGVAGVVVSPNNTASKYLCSKYGVEYRQMFEKALMGALIYYQMTAYYLTDEQLSPEYVPLKSDRQHHWDEAFGYFGVPIDFPSNVTNIQFIGKYANDHDALLNCNKKIMNAFLTGRAAINNGDEATRKSQVQIISKNIEKVFVASAIHYLNGAYANASDDAVRNHELSEAIAFIMALKYNPNKIISDSELDSILSSFKVGGRYDFYNVSLTTIQNARNTLSTIYSMNAIKDNL